MENNWKKINLHEYVLDVGDDQYRILYSKGYWYFTNKESVWFEKVENVRKGKELVSKLIK